VRLQSADADLDADVADLLLHEGRDFSEARREVAVTGDGFCGGGEVGAAFTARAARPVYQLPRRAQRASP